MKTLILIIFLQITSYVVAVEYQQEIQFDNRCMSGHRYTLTLVGDVLLHSPLQRIAASTGDFKTIWEDLIPYLKESDLTYANLEGTTAKGVAAGGKVVDDPGHVYDNYVYTQYPEFNYYPTLIADLLESGVGIVSTANNHALDRRSIGVDKTIEALEEFGLPFSGTRKKGETIYDRPWYTIVEKNGLKTGWISCTYETNGIPDTFNQILFCFKREDRALIKKMVSSLKDQVDALFVTPHWGSEYESMPDKQEIDFGKEMLELGATAIIGSHPHVIQPLERYITKDGRETLIIYSMGNFVSGQTDIKTKTSAIFFLGVTKGDNKTVINGLRYLPTYMVDGYLRPLTQKRSQEGERYIAKILSPKSRLTFGDPVVTNPDCSR